MGEVRDRLRRIRARVRFPRRWPTRILALLACLLLIAAVAVPFTLKSLQPWRGRIPRPPSARPLTPVEAATRGGYVALGDSYSSGEGTYPTPPEGTVERGAQRCHRSPKAYFSAVGASFRFRGGVVHVACAGATVAGVRNGQYGQPGQLGKVSAQTSLVTISVGGNDAGFSSVLTHCIVKAPLVGACRGQNAAVIGRLPGIQRNVTALLADINRRAPAARIILVGYPHLFAEAPTASADTIGITDQRWLNAMAYRLDLTLGAAARAADQRISRVHGPGTVEFIDTYNAFAGHEIGTPQPYLNDLDLDVRHLKARPDSFHPDAAGYQRLAQLVDQQIRRGPGRTINQYVLNPMR